LERATSVPSVSKLVAKTVVAVPPMDDGPVLLAWLPRRGGKEPSFRRTPDVKAGAPQNTVARPMTDKTKRHKLCMELSHAEIQQFLVPL